MQVNLSIQNPAPKQFNRPFIILSLIWLIASLLLFVSLRPGLNKPLQWDEVDYIQAARQGFLSNAMDKTALPPSALLELILSKLRNTKVQVHQSYVETNDVFILRHTHPPLLQYFLMLIGQDRLQPRFEQVQRFVQFSGGSLLIATMLWGYLKLAGEHSTHYGLIMTSAAGVLCGHYLASQLNCHLWIAITLVPACISVSRFMTAPSRSNGIITGFWIGVNFLGLQTGIFVAFWAVIAVGFSIVFNTASKAVSDELVIAFKIGDWIKKSCWMLIGFFIVLALTYPGAIIRLSLLRIFALYAFAIMKGDEYASVSGKYNGYLAMTFPILIVGMIGILNTLLTLKSKRSNIRIAFTVIGFGYGIVLLKFLLNITYITPSLAILSILGCASISSFQKRMIEIPACILFVISIAWIFQVKPEIVYYGSIEGYTNIAPFVEKTEVFVEGANIMQYYMPELANRIIPITTAEAGRKLIRRDTKTLQYLTMTPDELAGKIVILGAFNGHSPYEWESSLPADVKQLQVKGIGGRIHQFPGHLTTPDLNSLKKPSSP